LSSSNEGKREVIVENLVFSGFAPQDLLDGMELEVKLRYTAPPLKTVVNKLEDGTVRLSFEPPVKAAPGQSAVLYKNGCVVFGGIIK
jgi:tRNA U34 2-thiouridine synthase MnmA/TrmU